MKMSFKEEGVVRFFLSFADIVSGKVTDVKFQVSRESFRTTGPRKLFKGDCRIFNVHDPEAGIYFVTAEFSVAIVTTGARLFDELEYEDSVDDDSLGLRMEKFQDVCRAEPTSDHYKTLKRRVERLMENETLLPDEDLDFIE